MLRHLRELNDYYSIPYLQAYRSLSGRPNLMQIATDIRRALSCKVLDLNAFHLDTSRRTCNFNKWYELICFQALDPR